jgi:hypothetical protein
MIVSWTNIKGRDRKPRLSRRPTTKPGATPGSFARKWVDVTVAEMYTYFGILIIMALNPIKDLELYWGRKRAHFEAIVQAMSCNRFQDIARVFSISDSRLKLSEFQRVCYSFILKCIWLIVSRWNG